MFLLRIDVTRNISYNDSGYHLISLIWENVMTKEYGGYLPIEFAAGTPYYSGEHVVALNSGRYAIAYALRQLKWDVIYLPFYICATVEETIRRELPQMRIRYYHINQQFLPESVFLKEKEGILWVNYFGIQSDQIIQDMVQQYGPRILIDNTQSFFSAPQKGVCQVYSCRKFFGVSDGAYAVGSPICQQQVPVSASSLYASHLLQSYEYGTNYSYTLNKENEERLGTCGIQAMSPLTSAMLNVVDYGHVRQKRMENMGALHEVLAPVNEIALTEFHPALYYPFLCPSEALRQELIKKKIYVPQLWKETAENPDASTWEQHLSSCLCPLPIDQRYDTEDMKEIGRQVLALIGKQ